MAPSGPVAVIVDGICHEGGKLPGESISDGGFVHFGTCL
jgi:hypothetical protein